jgi:hypothetical protein
MTTMPAVSAPPLRPLPGEATGPRGHREGSELQRLLLDLRADPPEERGPAHTARRAMFAEVLATIGRQAVGSGPLEPLLAGACALIGETLSVAATALLEPSEASDRLVVRAAAGRLAGSLGEELGCGPVPAAGSGLRPGDAFLARHGLASSAMVALPGPSGPLGLLGAWETGFRAFAPDELRFLEAAASSLSAAMLRHRDELERLRLSARLDAPDRTEPPGPSTSAVAREFDNPLSYVTANMTFVAEEMAMLTRRLEAAKGSAGWLGEPGPGEPGLAESARQIVDAAADARDGVAKLRGLVRELQSLTQPQVARPRWK